MHYSEQGRKGPATFLTAHDQCRDLLTFITSVQPALPRYYKMIAFPLLSHVSLNPWLAHLPTLHSLCIPRNFNMLVEYTFHFTSPGDYNFFLFVILAVEQLWDGVFSIYTFFFLLTFFFFFFHLLTFFSLEICLSSCFSRLFLFIGNTVMIFMLFILHVIYKL